MNYNNAVPKKEPSDWLTPEYTSTNRNPYREWIGAQIRADGRGFDSRRLHHTIRLPSWGLQATSGSGAEGEWRVGALHPLALTRGTTSDFAAQARQHRSVPGVRRRVLEEPRRRSRPEDARHAPTGRSEGLGQAARKATFGGASTPVRACWKFAPRTSTAQTPRLAPCAGAKTRWRHRPRCHIRGCESRHPPSRDGSSRPTPSRRLQRDPQ